MNTQEQMNHIKELIKFLENQNKNLSLITPTNGGAIEELNVRLSEYLNVETVVSVLGSTFMFQNEFRDFLMTWIRNREHSDFGMSDLYHNQMKARAGVYLRHLVRVYKELLETLDNKPPHKSP